MSTQIDIQPGTAEVGRLAGATAIVTGGARGLGAAITRELVGAGARVAVIDVRDELADALVAELPDGTARRFNADLTDDDRIERVCREVEDAFGSIDVLVNNAGVDMTVALTDLSTQDWDRIVAVNLRAPALMSRAAWPAMSRAGGGRIVNIVSTAAKRAWANAAAYHATKWGLLGLSHALHVEGRDDGIVVSAVVAGGMRTPFLFERFPDLDPELLQEPSAVAQAVRFVLESPPGTVVPELMVLPTRESSWP
jgi:NAD(P)-dependent dehydrogenase (short-subunit alcohol dehydrogenase family)